ncbi:MAG: hypothetical protein ACL7BU_06935 [Candidatus Phlomobacter fragariae]
MDRKKGGANQEIIEMTLKQALRFAARESKAVRHSLILINWSSKANLNHSELNLTYAMAQVEQGHRLKSIENQIVQVSEEIEHIKEGTIPTGFQGYSYLKTKYGLSDARCRQLAMAWWVPYKKVPHIVPGSQITHMSVVDEGAFKNA